MSEDVPATAVNVLRLMELAGAATQHAGPSPSSAVVDVRITCGPQNLHQQQQQLLSVCFLPMSLLLEHVQQLEQQHAGSSLPSLSGSLPSAELLQNYTKALLAERLVLSAILAATRLSVHAMATLSTKGTTSGVVGGLLVRCSTGPLLVFVTSWAETLARLAAPTDEAAATAAAQQVAVKAAEKMARVIRCSLPLCAAMRSEIIVGAEASPNAGDIVVAVDFLKKVRCSKESCNGDPLLLQTAQRRDAVFMTKLLEGLSQHLRGISDSSRIARVLLMTAGDERPTSTAEQNSLLVAGKRPREVLHEPGDGCPAEAKEAPAAEERKGDDDTEEQEEEEIDLDEVPLKVWSRARQIAAVNAAKYGRRNRASAVDRIVLAPLGRPAALFVSLPADVAVTSGSMHILRRLAVQWSRPVFTAAECGSAPLPFRFIFLIVNADDTFERTLLSWTVCPHADNYKLLPIFVAAVACQCASPICADDEACSTVSSAVDVAATVVSIGCRFGVNWDESMFVGELESIGVGFRITKMAIVPTIAKAVALLEQKETADAAAAQREEPSAAGRRLVEDSLRMKIGLFQTLLQHQRRPEVIICHSNLLRLGLVRPPKDLRRTLAGMSIRAQQLLHVTPLQRKQFDDCMRTIFGPAPWQSTMMQYLREGKRYESGKAPELLSNGFNTGGGPARTSLISFFTPVILGHRVFQLLGWVHRNCFRVQIHLDLNPLFAVIQQPKSGEIEGAAAVSAPDSVHVDDLCEVFFPGKIRGWLCPCTPRLGMAHPSTPRDGRKLCRHVQYMLHYFMDVHVGDELPPPIGTSTSVQPTAPAVKAQAGPLAPIPERDPRKANEKQVKANEKQVKVNSKSSRLLAAMPLETKLQHPEQLLPPTAAATAPEPQVTDFSALLSLMKRE
jgi:hypothetical protein